MMKKLNSIKYVVVSLAILIIIWQVAFIFSDYSEALFPSPIMVRRRTTNMVFFSMAAFFTP